MQFAADAASSLPSAMPAVQHPGVSPWPGPGGPGGVGWCCKGTQRFACFIASGLASGFRVLIISRLCFHCVRHTCFLLHIVLAAYCPRCKLVLIRPLLYVIFADRRVLHRLLQCVAVLWLLRLMYCQLGRLWMPLNQFGLGATRSNVALRDLVTFASCSLRQVFRCLPDRRQVYFLLFVICL